MVPTNEDVIQMKSDCFRAGIYDVLDLTDKQILAMGVLCDQATDELLFGGAAGGGKSWLGCEWLLWNCLAYPGTRWAVGRHHLKQIRESTVVTFRKVCKKHGIPIGWWKYDNQPVYIEFANGSTITSIEMMYKPSDPDFDSFGSTEYTGGWIEEGGGISAKAREIFGTRVGRHLNDEYGISGKVLNTGNPSRNWMYKDFFKPWKSGVLPPNRKFIQSFATENNKRQSGYLEKLEGLTGQSRQRLLLGNWEFQDDPDQLIESTAILDLFNNIHILPDETKKHIVADIALHGSDIYRAAVFYGPVLMEHIAMAKSGGKDVLDKINDLRMRHGVRASATIYDADGVGGFIGGQGGFIPGAMPFHGNAQQIKTNTDKNRTFANLKAQCGFLLADDINQGLLYAKGVTETMDVELMSEELTHLKKIDTGDAPLRLKPKSSIKADLGRSPDFSDLWLMKKYYDIQQVNKPRQGLFSAYSS